MLFSTTSSLPFSQARIPSTIPRFPNKCNDKVLCFVDRASLYNLVNKANLVHNLFLVYLSITTCFSGDYGPIIRRNNCVYATLGTCNSVWMTVWYAGAYASAYQTLCDHHQEKQLYLCDTGYLLFCVDDCLVCRVNSTKHTPYKAVVMEVANTAHNTGLYLPASILPPETPPNES